MRPDANQSQIVAALRAAGATVTILAEVGSGCPDIIAGWRSHNYFFEIKNLTGRGNRLTEAQTKWINGWVARLQLYITSRMHLLSCMGVMNEGGMG